MTDTIILGTTDTPTDLTVRVVTIQHKSTHLVKKHPTVGDPHLSTDVPIPSEKNATSLATMTNPLYNNETPSSSSSVIIVKTNNETPKEEEEEKEKKKKRKLIGFYWCCCVSLLVLILGGAIGGTLGGEGKDTTTTKDPLVVINYPELTVVFNISCPACPTFNYSAITKLRCKIMNITGSHSHVYLSSWIEKNGSVFTVGSDDPVNYDNCSTGSNGLILYPTNFNNVPILPITANISIDFAEPTADELLITDTIYGSTEDLIFPPIDITDGLTYTYIAPTPSRTSTPTPSNSPSNTVTPTSSNTPSSSNTASITPSNTPSTTPSNNSPTGTPSTTTTSSETPTSSTTPSSTPTSSVTPSSSQTPSVTPTISASSSPLPACIMLRDINPGTGASNPKYFTPMNNVIFFQAADCCSSTNTELWKSDGSKSGTGRVIDLNLGSQASQPQFLKVFNNLLYFVATNGSVAGSGIWASNGTAAGTFFVRALGNPMFLTVMGNFLYFSASDNTYGRELWRSDGTVGGVTEMVADINPGSPSSNPNGYNSIQRESFTINNNVLYFAANKAGFGIELWRSDGSNQGTWLVRDLFPGNGDGLAYPGTDENFFAVMNNVLYFPAMNGYSVAGDYGTELYRSDGGENGTYIVADLRVGTIGSYPTKLTVLNDTILFFRASNTYNGTMLVGDELWVTNGTENGTTLVKDIRYGSQSSGIDFLTVMNGALFFSASDGISGTELWRSEGTFDTTVLVKDINPGSTDSYPMYLTAVNNVLVFIADGLGKGAEIWRSDGWNDTYLIQDIYLGSSGSWPMNLVGMNNAVYFQATNGTASGIEPWKCTL